MIPRVLGAGPTILRNMKGRFDACNRLYSAGGQSALRFSNLIGTVIAFVIAIFGPLMALLGFAALAHTVSAEPSAVLMAATGYSSTATVVTTLADLYEKTNTDVKTGIKLQTEEAKWFRAYPREQITVSGNENRIPLVLTQPTHPAMIDDGGNEAVMTTPAPTSGTFMPVQMNARFGYTGLAQALEARARGAMIESQTAYQSAMTTYKFSRGIGVQTYGQSGGAVAVVETTGSAGTDHNSVALKNAYNSSTFCPGGTTAQDLYLSNLFRVGDHIALVRGGSLVEFANVDVVNTDGSVDFTTTSSVTPTANDVIYFANADGDSTITGTDKDNWPVGFTEALLASSVHGVATSSYAGWAAGSAVTTSQRLSFQVKERMINDCWNKGGVQINRFIVSQGVRRDAIAGEQGARRYDSADVDIEGDLKPGANQKYFTSQLALPGVMIGWFDQAYSKIELSDLPEEGGGRGIFKLDKVQGKSQIAASYDYFYAKIVSSRAAMGYASNLTES